MLQAVCPHRALHGCSSSNRCQSSAVQGIVGFLTVPSALAFKPQEVPFASCEPVLHWPSRWTRFRILCGKDDWEKED